MTPCEEKGYKVGDEFVVTKDTTFPKGARVRLSDDDRTHCPAFKSIGCKAEDWEDWHYISLENVRKVSGDSIITRTNGQPYATESTARQQLIAKGLQSTHKVVPHGGGYALVAISRTADPITLQPGDYVSTKGMTEDQYHAVARAFENAGCPRFCGVEEPGSGDYLEWWDGELVSTSAITLGGRHLTIDQVLNAANATPQPEHQPAQDATPSPITTLLTARKARDEAEAAYQAALEVVRNELPGYVLAEVGVDMAAGPDKTIIGGEDMTDPTNWREGDVLECVEPGFDLTIGKFYTVEKVLTSTDIRLVCDDLDDYPVRMPQKFRFHHRPA